MNEGDTKLETLQQTEEGELSEPSGSDSPANRSSKQLLQIAGGAILILGAVYWAFVEPKIRSTLVTVIIAVATSAGIWIGANLLFNQVRERWLRFSTILFAVIGALVGIVLHGNLVTVGSGSGFLTWVVGPLLGAAGFGAVGLALALNDDPAKRRMIALGGSAVIGLTIGLVIRDAYHPGLDPVAIIVYTLIGAALFAGINLLRKHDPLPSALVGGAIGWIVGAWGGADLGDGSTVTSIVAAMVPAVMIGARLSMTGNPDYKARLRIDNRSRAVIFIGPALFFIFVMLVVPAARTLYLSFLDADSEKAVGFQNFWAIFSDRNSLDTENWTNMFGSVPFWLGLAVLGLAVIIGARMKRLTGRAVEIGNPTVAPLVIGALLLLFGVFTALRGTLINNLWWVAVVTFASTSLGLAIAVLADQKGGEKVAKSIIFLPMALSLVGASIIWRFVYRARDTTTEQTGVLNALWVGLGRLSTGSGLPTLLFGAFVLAAFVALLMVSARMLVRYGWGRAVVPMIATVLVGWFFFRYAGIISGRSSSGGVEFLPDTSGVGGYKVAEDGTVSGDTVNFIQDGPYNNLWLMVIFIWIQTGFAMVIMSAAIKAVPTELIEAAKIDGATTSQVFWRVTLPQIATTIGVVVTTLIVGVMKVFDIVKVTTNGQFGSQVLANQMFQEAFSFQNKGKGAALAILIFVAVLPVMIYNIRRMQSEG
jgi:ABC-type sugar transport system permease subunit